MNVGSCPLEKDWVFPPLIYCLSGMIQNTYAYRLGKTVVTGQFLEHQAPPIERAHAHCSFLEEGKHFLADGEDALHSRMARDEGDLRRPPVRNGQSGRSIGFFSNGCVCLGELAYPPKAREWGKKWKVKKRVEINPRRSK